MDALIVRSLVILAVAYIALSVLDTMHKDWLKSCQKEKLGELSELSYRVNLQSLWLVCFCSSWLDDWRSSNLAGPWACIRLRGTYLTDASGCSQ